MCPPDMPGHQLPLCTREGLICGGFDVRADLFHAGRGGLCLTPQAVLVKAVICDGSMARDWCTRLAFRNHCRLLLRVRGSTTREVAALTPEAGKDALQLVITGYIML